MAIVSGCLLAQTIVFRSINTNDQLVPGSLRAGVWWFCFESQNQKSERALPGSIGQGPFALTRLWCGDVFSLIALRSLFDLELDHLAFVECLVSLHLNGGEVNEYVFARLALDETITFRCIKPLHYTLFSAHLLDSSFMSDRYLPGVTPVGGRRKPIVYSHPSRLA